LQTRMEVDAFLKSHGVELEYTVETLSGHREDAPTTRLVISITGTLSDYLISVTAIFPNRNIDKF